MAVQLLKDRETPPSPEVLRGALGEVHPVWEAFVAAISAEPYSLDIEWRYYKDGGGWLGKVARAKKTIVWISVLEGFFKASFFFLPRHLEGLAALGLDETEGLLQKEWGNMIPLIFDIRREEQLVDVLRVAEFKIAAK